MSDPDTIVAAATPPGRGGVAIVRASGPAVPAMLAPLIGAVAAARVQRHPRRASFAQFLAADGRRLDQGLALFFEAPHSYTAEHVLELHAHGGPVLLEVLIGRVLELGARRAQPGEFTQRAYLNGKLDLAQAEAVASLIDAASESAARAALRSLEGEFSRQVQQLREALGELRVWIEAAIDFADEDIDFLSDHGAQARLAAISATLQALRASSRRGRLLTEGMTVVIAGRPNAGKSTLLNRLAGHEAAIVTPLPGTTRDLLRERIVLDGLPLHVLDTAGLRGGHACAADGAATRAGGGSAHGTSANEGLTDAIEAEGIRRARAAMARADLILFVIDAAADPNATAYAEEQPSLPRGVPVTLVLNKLDLAHDSWPPLQGSLPQVRISALTGEGVAALVDHLKQAAGFTGADEGLIAARARHLEALERVAQHVGTARAQLHAHQAPELLAEELRLAQRALGEILGEESSEELLARIFASFCIGK